MSENTTPVVTKTKTKKSQKLTKIARERDNAREVAAASGKRLTTDQVRILRSLSKCKHPISRTDLKELVGIGRDRLYSQKWLANLNDLDQRRLIYIGEPQKESGRGYTHKISASGSKLLQSVEKSVATTV